MEETHQYRVVAWWTSGLTGIAKSDSAPNAIHFTAPPEFGGLQGRWAPEELLLGAVGGCFTTTFRTVAAHSNFEYTDLEVETQGTAAKTADGYRFGEIVIRPKLTIFSEEERNRAVDLLEKTQALCLVSRTLGDPEVWTSDRGWYGCLRRLIVSSTLDFSRGRREPQTKPEVLRATSSEGSFP